LAAQKTPENGTFEFANMRECALRSIGKKYELPRNVDEGSPMSDNMPKREQPQISIPCDREMLARVKSAAERQHRSVANFARIALAKELERQGQEASAA
jgi:hypothetical protein